MKRKYKNIVIYNQGYKMNFSYCLYTEYFNCCIENEEGSIVQMYSGSGYKKEKINYDFVVNEFRKFLSELD